MNCENITPEKLTNIENEFSHRSKAVRAAVRYARRQMRLEHPKGSFDGARRWYPAASERLNISIFREPSRAYPFNLLQACRAAIHCAILEECDDVKLVRRIAKLICTSPTTESAIADIRNALTASRKKRKVQQTKLCP